VITPFGFLAVNELPDLPADRLGDIDQSVVRLADIAVEKLHHPEHFVAPQQREGKSAVQAGSGHERRAFQAFDQGNVGDPDRGARRKSAPYQALVPGYRVCGAICAGGDEFVDLGGVDAPVFAASE